MKYPKLTLALPEWIESFVTDKEQSYASLQERMQFVIELSRLNVKHETGGPFGAAIFDCHTNRLVAPGVNVVIPAVCSVAHAEIVAIVIAQQVLGQYELGVKGMPTYELVTSTEPCAMCFGAIPWSGIRRLVCGARRNDAMKIGFDEGPRPPNWIQELEKRSITVVRDVLQQQAASVLLQYHERGGEIYNGDKVVSDHQPKRH